MVTELRQQLKLAQQLVMTPQLQMAIKLLQLSRLELLETIQQELQENPTLEEVQDTAESPSAEPPETESATDGDVKEVTIDEKLPDDVDWSNYLEEYSSFGKATFEVEKRSAPSFEAFLSRKESLQEHLLWQLMMSAPDQVEKGIGTAIVGNLTSEGYLDVTIEELVKSTGASPEKISQLLERMQTFDPIGVCARDLKECLLIQVRHLNLENTLVTDIIEHHLNHLENRNMRALCKALGVKQEAIMDAVEVIRRLEPRPGRPFTDDTSQHIIPDIYVYKLDQEFVIVLNDSGTPRLRVSQFYRQNLGRPGKASPKEREYIQEKIRSATWLIRSIHQRQKTIYRVMESILNFQMDFFEKGVAHLKPMVLRDVAQDIDMHESTISRVTTNKYVHTPRGIFELKYFFNSSINRLHGDAIASVSVKEKIRQVIESEDRHKPYSDNKIAQILKTANINIARRTVAKYREMLNVLPSSKRKHF